MNWFDEGDDDVREDKFILAALAMCSAMVITAMICFTVVVVTTEGRFVKPVSSPTTTHQSN